MQTKLESLTLSKFNTSVIECTERIFGGAVPSKTEVSDGGCTCSSGAGSDDNWSWDSDTIAHDENGNQTGRELHGGVRNEY